MRPACLLVVCSILAAAMPEIFAPAVPAEPPSKILKGTDPATSRPYCLYVPSGYKARKACPLVISCHGTVPYDRAEHQVREFQAVAEENGWIVAAPELKGTDGILGDGNEAVSGNEKEVLSLLELLAGKYNIDRANVLLTGFSGGAFAAYGIGLRHPEAFSCLAIRSGNFNAKVLPRELPAAAKKMLILIYYSQNDPGAITEQSKRAVQFLKEAGADPNVRMLEGAGHVRRPETAAEFFLARQRPSRPSLPDSTTAPATGPATQPAMKP